MAIELLERHSAGLLTDPEIQPALARYVPQTPPPITHGGSSNPIPYLEVAGANLQSRVADIEHLGLGIDFIGCAPLTLQPILLPMSRAVVVPLALDPHFRQQALGMPRSVRRHVSKLARTELEFDTFYILHELTPASFTHIAQRQDLLIADLGTAIGPPKVDPVAGYLARGTEIVARYGAATAAVAIAAPLAIAATVAVAAATVTVVAAATPLLGLGAVAALAAAPVIGLDPVLIGAVTSDGDLSVGRPAAFYRIASWR